MYGCSEPRLVLDRESWSLLLYLLASHEASQTSAPGQLRHKAPALRPDKGQLLLVGYTAGHPASHKPQLAPEDTHLQSCPELPS